MLLRTIAVCLIVLFNQSSHAADCSHEPYGVHKIVSYVLDGDTVELQSGLRVRLIGINAPELGKNGEPDEPLAVEARNTLIEILKQSGFRVTLLYGIQKEDKYGRRLAHVFNGKQKNVQHELLRQGLVFNLPYPPNLNFQSCYRRSENEARSKNLNLWAPGFHHSISESLLTRQARRGYRIIKGTVSRVYYGRKSVWINFTQNRITARIDKRDLQYFQKIKLRSLKGTTITIHGYMTPSFSKRYRNYFYMRLRHSDYITFE